MSAFLRYMVVSAVLVVLVAAVAGALMPASSGGVWVAASLAFLVQVVAFGGLARARSSGLGWLVAWGGGTLLRLLTVLGTALWLGATERFPVAQTLLSLAGFLFVLMLLEPVLFRTGMRSR